MALYMKQDFSPPVLSRRWIAVKFRPNMLVNNRRHIEAILESGLLFREDSVLVEQEASSPEEVWSAAGGGRGGWLTRGEGALTVVAVAAALAVFPPRSFHRTLLLNLLGYVSMPLVVRSVHRALCRGSLASLLAVMRDYLALARRTAACVKEYAALHTQLGSLTSSIASCHTLLCRQQSALAVLMSRASSALLGNAPWLRADVAWQHVQRAHDRDLTKIHHAFLVVQSTLLKHIAMAHYVPPSHARRVYKNHNERIYWLHHTIIPHLTAEFVEHYEALDRMYRLLKNCGSNDTDNLKKLGVAAIDNWLYSDVHSGIARACLDLKLNLNKCNTLDVFLDSCALNKQDLDSDVLNKDIDDIIDGVTKCLTALQNSQIRLKKIRNKFHVPGRVVDNVECDEEKVNVLRIEDKQPEVKDEVFYFVKTDDDDNFIQPAEDLFTGPGKKERKNTAVVLSELKRKLGRREDVMRERERQALVKTMPELKDNIPEFPRQNKFEEFFESKQFIGKCKRRSRKRRLFQTYRIQPKKAKYPKYGFNVKTYEKESDIDTVYYEANSKLSVKSRLISLSCKNKRLVLTKWCKYSCVQKPENSNNIHNVYDSNGASDFSDDDVPINVVENMDSKYKFSKRDLELTSSSSESNYDVSQEKRLALKNVRRKRKTYPVNRASPDEYVDESLKPIEYSFGTGIAMASMLQVNNARIPNMAEEVFIGNGEISNDSGNDEDA